MNTCPALEPSGKVTTMDLSTCSIASLSPISGIDPAINGNDLFDQYHICTKAIISRKSSTLFGVGIK